MRRILRAVALLAGLLPALAAAQVPNFPQTLPANTVVGRLGVGAGPAQAIPFATLGPTLITSNLLVTPPLTITGLTLSITGQAGKVIGGAGGTFTANPVLGLVGTLGSLGLAGNTSGTVTIQPAAAAGTWTLTLPITAGTSGQVLTTNGSGVTTWSATGAGNVLGPGSSTDNAIVLWNGIGGTTIKNGPAGTTTTVLHGNAAGAPAYSAVVLTTDVSGILPVANGGTALSTGTSGGILGYTAAGTLASSVALTANAIVLGGGAGATPTPLASLGTTTTVLHGNAAGAPSFGAVALAADVSGTLPFTNGGTGISTATSGGIPYFNTTTSIASSALLTSNALVVGGGAGAAPSTPIGLGTSTTVLHGNAGGAPSFGAVSLTADVSGTLPVTNGGTGLATGTSGGVLGFTASGTLASSVALSANQIVLGGGAAATPIPLGSLGTTATVLHGNAGGAPSFSAVALGSDVTGQLPVANGGTGQTTAAAARSLSGLNIDSVTTFGNANYSASVADRVIATTVNFTAQRTVTLPPVASYNGGQQVVVVDSFGAINGANTLVIAAAGGDSIDGLASITVTTQYSGAVLWPIGSNRWGYIATVAGAGTGTVTSVATGPGVIGGTIVTTGTINIQNMVPGGRLTLTSAIPITNADVAGATVIYYAPLNHPFVPIYDGSNMTLKQFTASSTDAVGLSVTLGANWTTNTNYDFFTGLNSGIVTLCSGPSWNSGAVAGSDTARGTGAGSTELQLFNGVWTNKVSMTCRYSNTQTFTCGVNQCTLLGSVRMTASGQTTDSLAFRFVSNAYNAVKRPMRVTEPTANWTYTTSTYRQANANAANQLDFLQTLPGGSVTATVLAGFSNSAVNIAGSVGIDIDTVNTTTIVNNINFLQYSFTTSAISGQSALYVGFPGLGRHTAIWKEWSGTTGTSTWYGNSGGVLQSGIFGEVVN